MRWRTLNYVFSDKWSVIANSKYFTMFCFILLDYRDLDIVFKFKVDAFIDLSIEYKYWIADYIWMKINKCIWFLSDKLIKRCYLLFLNKVNWTDLFNEKILINIIPYRIFIVRNLVIIHDLNMNIRPTYFWKNNANFNSS